MPCLVVKTRNTLYSVWALVFLTYERLSKTKSEFLNHFIACRWTWVSESLSRVRLFATPWTIQSMEFSMECSLSLLQGIFPTQGSNPGIPRCRQILYQLSHKGSPKLGFTSRWKLVVLKTLNFLLFRRMGVKGGPLKAHWWISQGRSSGMGFPAQVGLSSSSLQTPCHKAPQFVSFSHRWASKLHWIESQLTVCSFHFEDQRFQI